METGIKEEVEKTELPTLRGALTNYEEFLFGSSLKHPSRKGAKIFNFDDIIKENFPAWVFLPINPKFSLQQLNDTRLGQYMDMGIGFGPFDPYSIPDPDHTRFRVFLGQLAENQDLQRVEFGFTKMSEEGSAPMEIFTSEVIGEISFYPEYEDNFRLEDVPGHPGRRYLVPVRKS